MGIEDAGGGLNDGDSLVISLDLVDVTGLARYNSDQVEAELNWVQVIDESVWESGLLASWDQDVIAGGSQVADDSCAWRSICRQWLKS